MTNENATVEKAAPVQFNIDEARKLVEGLSAEYDAVMLELVAAVNEKDAAKMQALGGQMAAIAVKREKASARINRAENGTSSVDMATKITARTEAYAAISQFMAGNEAVKRLLILVPTVKQLRVKFEKGAIVAVTSTGGFRTGGASGKGSRVRAKYTGKAFEGEKSKHEIVDLFGKKHGQTVAWLDMPVADKAALVDVIVKAEKLTNVNAK